MAEYRGGVGGYNPNLLGAIQTGFNIRQARTASDLARKKYDVELKQLALQNKRLEEDRARKAEELEYTQGIREVQMGKTTSNVDMMNRGFKRSMKAVGMEIPEDMPIDKETYDRFMKIATTKDPALQEVGEEEFAKDIGLTVDAYARKAKATGLDVGAFEEAQKAEAVLAGEARKLAGQKELETYKTTEKIRAEKAKAGLKPAGKPETYSGQSGLWEKDAKGKWKLSVPDPKISKKTVDKEMRELNLSEKIGKRAEREASVKFGKPPQQFKYDAIGGVWVENTEYPFDEYRDFVTQRTMELRTKAGILDMPGEAITEEVEGEVAGPPPPPPEEREGQLRQTFEQDPRLKVALDKLKNDPRNKDFSDLELMEGIIGRFGQ